MSNRFRFLPIVILIATLVGLGVTAPVASAGVSQAVIALAGPLAEQFGVPAGSVTGMLEGGMSLESVTQLLLVSKSSEKELDDVKSVYDESDAKIAETASQLKVAAADYSPDKVSAAIDDAKTKAQADAAAKASTAASDATEKAAGAANDAVGSALGGFKR